MEYRTTKEHKNKKIKRKTEKEVLKFGQKYLLQKFWKKGRIDDWLYRIYIYIHILLCKYNYIYNVKIDKFIYSFFYANYNIGLISASFKKADWPILVP